MAVDDPQVFPSEELWNFPCGIAVGSAMEAVFFQPVLVPVYFGERVYPRVVRDRAVKPRLKGRNQRRVGKHLLKAAHNGHIRRIVRGCYKNVLFHLTVKFFRHAHRIVDFPCKHGFESDSVYFIGGSDDRSIAFRDELHHLPDARRVPFLRVDLSASVHSLLLPGIGGMGCSHAVKGAFGKAGLAAHIKKAVF